MTHTQQLQITARMFGLPSLNAIAKECQYLPKSRITKKVITRQMGIDVFRVYSLSLIRTHIQAAQKRQKTLDASNESRRLLSDSLYRLKELKVPSEIIHDIRANFNLYKSHHLKPNDSFVDGLKFDWLGKHKHSGFGLCRTPIEVGLRTDTNGKSGWDCVSWHYQDYYCIRLISQPLMCFVMTNAEYRIVPVTEAFQKND